MAFSVLKVSAEQKVNDVTAGSQEDPSVISLPDGGWLVTWTSAFLDPSLAGIAQRRFSSTGTTSGPDVVVNETTLSSQDQPEVTLLADGGWVVVWRSNLQDGSGQGVFLRRYDSTGTTSGADMLVNATTAGDQGSPSVAGLPDGGWVVTWESDDGAGSGIFQRRYDSTGATVGADEPVNQFKPKAQFGSTVTALADGGWVVTWVSVGQDGSDLGIYQRRFDSAGLTSGADIRVNATVAGEQAEPSVAALPDGGWVVAWQSDLQDGSGKGIFMCRYGSAGQITNQDVLVNVTTSGHQEAPSITALDDGGWVITWMSLQDYTVGYEIHQRRYDATGFAPGPEMP